MVLYGPLAVQHERQQDQNHAHQEQKIQRLHLLQEQNIESVRPAMKKAVALQGPVGVQHERQQQG